jgi:hypothetical protein
MKFKDNRGGWMHLGIVEEVENAIQLSFCCKNMPRLLYKVVFSMVLFMPL